MLKHLSAIGKLFVPAAALIFFPVPAKAQLYDAFTVLRLPDRTVYFVPQGYAAALPLSYYPTAFDPYRAWPYAYASYPFSPGVYNPLSYVSPLSYVPGVATAPMPEGTSITVRVPSNAEVWIQGKKMTETGSERRFNLPSLDPSTTYDYDVRVAWSTNGRQFSDTHHLKVRAGDQQSITYVAANTKAAVAGPAPADNPKK